MDIGEDRDEICKLASKRIASKRIAFKVQTHIYLQFGFDTAENELCEVCPLSVYRSARSALRRTVGPARRSQAGRSSCPSAAAAHLEPRRLA